MFEVEFYQDKIGEEPIKTFIEELQSKARTNKIDRFRADKILVYIRVLERMGVMAGLPYVKYIAMDIWELRPLKDRIFFFFLKNDTYVLLHYYLKKTQKTPKKELQQAQQNMSDHLQRSENDGK